MTGARVLTAAVLIPVVVAVVLRGPLWLLALLVAMAMLLALLEFFRLGATVGLRGYPRWTSLCALGIVYSQWSLAEMEVRFLAGGLATIRRGALPVIPVEVVLLAFVLGLGALAVVGRRGIAELLSALSVSAAGLLLVALPLSYIVRLEGLRQQGPLLVLFLLVLVWVGDMLAYFVGRGIGRLKMAPVLSPNKTWEGAAANLLGSLAVAGMFTFWIDLPGLHLVAVAALANIAGQLGDLLESAYKRSAGAKDSGALLPGHGGVLDRIDSLTLAAPVAWWCFAWIVHGSTWT